jgi:hypothetical protein
MASFSARAAPLEAGVVVTIRETTLLDACLAGRVVPLIVTSISRDELC